MEQPWRRRSESGRAAVAESPMASAPIREVAARPGLIARLASLKTFEALNDRSFRWFIVSMLSQFSSMHMQMVV
ncbi:MAG: hypothetical protein IT299_12325, partial [Dehalococcoidia bacterium]|nr:hypothetical protein [Dehalococcoidia bacterium]